MCRKQRALEDQHLVREGLCSQKLLLPWRRREIEDLIYDGKGKAKNEHLLGYDAQPSICHPVLDEGPSGVSSGISSSDDDIPAD